MNDRVPAIVAALGRIGVSISPSESSTGGWGWAMQNAKIARDWEGSYPTATAAADAALSWLLEHARKGLLCHHIHPAVTAEAAEPVEGTCFKQEWWYTLN